MAKVTRESQLKRAQSRVKSAKSFRSKEGYDELWTRLVDLYRGKHFAKKLSSQDLIAVNIAFSTINVIAPSVAVNHPKLIIRARRPELYDQSTMLEVILNYWWKHYDVHDEFRLAVNDFLVLGHGWLKTGWRFIEEEVDNEDYDTEVENLIAERDQFGLDNPDMRDQLADDDELASGVDRTKTRTVEDRPFVERVSPFDMFVDPTATSLRHAGWLAQRSVVLLSDAKNDESYDSAARSRLAADSHAETADSRPTPHGRVTDSDEEYVTIWEYWDIKGGTMCVFAENSGEFLVKPTEMPYTHGHPYIMLRDYEVIDYFYPMGELEALEPLQHELNLTRSAMLNDRKAFRRRHLIDESAFDTTGRAALESDADNVIIPTNGSVPLNEAIIPMPTPTVNSELYQQSEIIENDIVNISALNEYERGALPEVRRTATEAGIIQDAANARAGDKLARVERCIGKIAENLLSLAQQYMTEPQWAYFTGGPEPIWFEFTPEDIEGEFDFEVAGGSTMPLNETQRRQTAMQLLQVAQPFVEMQILNPQELLRHVLVEGFGMSNPERFFVQQQPMGPPEEEIPQDDPRIAPHAAAGAPGEAPMGPGTPSPAGGALSAPGGTPNGGGLPGLSPGGGLPPELIGLLGG